MHYETIFKLLYPTNSLLHFMTYTADFFLEVNQNCLELSEEAPLTHLHMMTTVITTAI